MLIETLAAMAVLSGGGQEAAAMSGGGQERAAPRGDYRDSCSGAYVNRGRLYADCRTRNNQVRGTSIELNRCSDEEIRNDNGLLVCGSWRGQYEDDQGGGGGGGGGWNQPPRGDYQSSCGSLEVTRGRLYAQCRTRSPGFRRSSIELRRCGSTEIRNDNGLLVCGSWRGQYEDDQGGGGGGGGWGRQSITVYQDANFRGPSQRFTSEMPNLGNTGLNDQISSLQVTGTWEACTDAYFRGRCQTFTGDVRNLSILVMNDRISSLRPVRR